MGVNEGGTVRARSRPDEGGATGVASDTPEGHETRSETRGRPLVGPGKPPAPTAEPACGPKQAAHAGPGRPPVYGCFTLPGSTAAYRGRQVTEGKAKTCKEPYRAS